MTPALVCSPADLIGAPRPGRLVERVVDTTMPTAFGTFMAVGYRSRQDDGQHVAFVKGDVAGVDDVLVHVHVRCLAGDVFHALTCDCGRRLPAALEAIERAGEGVVLYLTREGDGVATQILADLGVGTAS